MGRLKGSKNNPKIKEVIADTSLPIIKRGRGRPRKNKINIAEPITVSSGNLRDLKRQIRELKKVKLQCRPGTPERINLHRKIKDLKKQLKELKDNKPGDISPLTYEKKERVLEVKEEKYPDNNGCNYFNLCRAINLKGENKTCYNTIYFIDKLKRECTELKKENI
jgi:hypothetical protein